MNETLTGPEEDRLDHVDGYEWMDGGLLLKRGWSYMQIIETHTDNCACRQYHVI